MATHAPITGAPPRAPSIKLNGVTFIGEEPYPFLDQAHALACCLEEAASDDASMNNDILQAAARGIATLIHLAAIGLAEYGQVGFVGWLRADVQVARPAALAKIVGIKP